MTSGGNLIELLAQLPPAKRKSWVDGLSEAQVSEMAHGWRGVRARENQLAPDGDWQIWAIIAGRGFGKTRSGAEWLREQWKAGKKSLGLVGATRDDVRDLMVEGPSGICNIGPPHERPIYEVQRRRVVWPDGVKGYLFSADAPERIRGREFGACWCDEVAAWRFEQSRARELRGGLGTTRAEDAWNNMLFCMRTSENPQVVVTTTPKPYKLIKDIISDADHVSRGSTYANRSHLSKVYFGIINKFAGTRVGRQEIDGEVLENLEGALWTWEMINAAQTLDPVPDNLSKVVVAIDPQGSAASVGAETGIVVAGVDRLGIGHVIEDVSGSFTPNGWAQQAVSAYRKHRANSIVAEVNFGGDMVEATLRTIDPNIPITLVRATRGKDVRADPVSSLYERGRVLHHLQHSDLLGRPAGFELLEGELTGWVPHLGMKSPNRLDALVWALTELIVDPDIPLLVGAHSMSRPSPVVGVA